MPLFPDFISTLIYVLIGIFVLLLTLKYSVLTMINVRANDDVVKKLSKEEINERYNHKKFLVEKIPLIKQEKRAAFFKEIEIEYKNNLKIWKEANPS